MNKSKYATGLELLTSGSYKKNIDYFFDSDSGHQFEVAKKIAGSSGQTAWMLMRSYANCGRQLQVQREVSDDLIASEFSDASRIQDVVWPADCIEFYFEDPRLPTMLAMKSTPQKLQKMFPQLDIMLKESEYISVLMFEGGDIKKGGAKLVTLNLKPDMYDRFIQEASCPPMNDLTKYTTKLSDNENAAISVALNLVLKVLVFASIPKFKPSPLTRKQMKHGGKSGVAGRPDRESERVCYLPSIIHEQSGKPVQHNDGDREFLGRRGHIRWFHSERFVNRKGEWTFVRPVVNPKTGKYPEHRIVVRKP